MLYEDYGIEKVTRFKTNDGEAFETVEEAKTYIANSFRQYLENKILAELPSTDTDRIMTAIVPDYEGLLDISRKLSELLNVK